MAASYLLRQLQFLRPHDDDRERPGLVGFQVRVDLLHRDAVDGVLDLVQRADAAADEEVVGDGAGAGAGAFALHDGAGLEAGLGAVEFRLRDALLEAVQLANEAVERRLGAVVARAGVAEDAALAFKAAVTGPDAVTQA